MPITLHLGETSVTFPFSVDNAKAVSETLTGANKAFAAKEKAERPQRLPMLEYLQKGDANGDVFLEICCNPNAYPDAFQAKALVTIRKEDVKITSEGLLSALKADVDNFLEQHG